MTDDPQAFSVDLSNCDREPIHLLGRIQAFGYLIAVSMDWMVQHVSANIAEIAGRSPDDCLGIPLSELLPSPSVHDIRDRLQGLSPGEGSERIFGIDLFGNGRRFDLAIHVSGHHSIVLEAEPCMPSATGSGILVKTMIGRIERCTTLEALHVEAVRQLRAVTGFDRVMLYRFAPDGSGSVIAEAARRGIEPFLGLNYPATDIPAQARRLYVRNRTRIIADVGAETVPVVPGVDPDGTVLDLSLSVTRAVSPIHVEYLTNMGVGASFSISIVIGGELWGLFALHHYGPRRLSMELRSTLELFGQIVALVIEGRLAKQMRLVEEAARNLHDKVVGRLVSTSPSPDELINFAADFREMIPSDGFAVWSEGRVRTVGTCPFPDDMPGLARFLNRAAASRVYVTDEISAAYPKAADFADRAAGLIAIPISRTPRDYLIFFRRELVETVTWAGDPTRKEASYGPNGPRLSPRKSFEAWQETVRGKSAPWSASERKSAEALRVAILEVLLRFNEENERLREVASQRQELLIAELNHRVRNILAVIRAVVLQSRGSATSVNDFASIIGGRIQALARAHDQITDSSFAAQSLEGLVRTEAEAYVGEKAGRFELSGPPVLVNAEAFSTLALVMHEMVTNSAKYGALSDSTGIVSVDWSLDDNAACTIDWRESGGPAVQAPTRRGFGSTIIERSIPHELGGEATLNWRLKGLEARFVLPAKVISMGSPNAAPAPAQAAAPASPGALAGLTALLVEDNMIMALDAEQMLLEHGLGNVFTAMSLADAMRIVVEERLDVAMLDVNLGNETSFPLIEPLNAKGVPYVFVTGYGETLDLPDEAVPGTMSIKKPYSAADIVEALAAAVSRQAG
ncbi:two-component system sensor histidine kinase/response regulator [Acuticoccus sediminis]|uniref:Blue-light-activated histidine kinase n=1 Tax=Acuticoccus sediminis TaxID=2184697 RepID=A0A8B2NFS3_9HYPH|nr:HWE histidine kinase domain-containing protein [Acuticoccus sediminis]RAH96530.1 two-component system sensor histidine kinase/response regulator [Acuticoccus sediminis]